MGSYFSVPLAVSIAIPLIAGSIVSASTADNVLVWYKTLKKPSWNLPTPIFGPTWSFLYVFLGLASFVVWTQGGFAEQSGPLILYAVNLVLNLSWMPLFFNKKDFVLAQIDNIATLGTAVVLAKQFYRVKPVAGYLLWPYVAFLAFANALNFYHTKNNQNRAIDEDLYRSEDKKNPGETGYGAATDRSKGTKGLPSEGKQAPGYGSTTGRIFGETDGPSSGVNACLAAPCVGRGRSGRPVLVRAAAAPQMKMRAAAGKRVGTVRSTMSLHRAPTVARFA